MNPIVSLFSSSIGKKFLMAITGLVLVGFVVGHLVGNLQIFSSADKINGYAEFLHSLGPTLWAARIFLIACTFIHIWAAVALTRENWAARGAGSRYAVKHTIRATLSSRTMRWTGFVVLAFLFYHLAHFTFGGADAQHFKEALHRYTMKGDYHILGVPVVNAGTEVLDVESMVIYGFRSPLISAFYVFAIALLSMHLRHGFDSMFQTLGIRNSQWAVGLRRFSIFFAIAYFLGNLAIPAAVLSGKVTLRPEVAAAASASVAKLSTQR